ncbi:MAG: M23 family metallopeptidase [Spirochaetales bacterium]|nr:M23 family metallopeptidase [Spirochaetales bacterium]
MKKLLILIFLILNISLYAQDSYTVKSGDTIYSIARSFGISQEELMKANNMTSPSQLLAGMKLIIPTKEKSSDLIEYVVKPGDTLYGIARKFKMAVSQLLEINKLTKESVIKPGQKILVKKSSNNSSGPSSQQEVKPSNDDKSTNSPVNPPSTKKYPDNFWPLNGSVEKSSGRLNGVKIIGQRGQEVKAISEGTIVWIAPHRGFGYVVLVETSNHYRYSYIGLGVVNVSLGDMVKKGQVLGQLDVNYHDQAPALYLVITDSQVNVVDPWKAPRT